MAPFFLPLFCPFMKKSPFFLWGCPFKKFGSYETGRVRANVCLRQGGREGGRQADGQIRTSRAPPEEKLKIHIFGLYTITSRATFKYRRADTIIDPVNGIQGHLGSLRGHTRSPKVSTGYPGLPDLVKDLEKQRKYLIGREEVQNCRYRAPP